MSFYFYNLKLKYCAVWSNLCLMPTFFTSQQTNILQQKQSYLNFTQKKNMFVFI